MPTHPIILAHGIARFDIFRKRIIQRLGLDENSLPDHLHYFRNIRSHLGAHQRFTVHPTSVRFAGPVGLRAEELKRQIEGVLALSPGHTKVHIIAHSMGGLDARHMIVGLGMRDRVCSLTTIGTPHHGSAFADWGLANRGDRLLERLDKVIDVDGFLNLTSEDTDQFNRDAEPAEADNEVFYQTYACWEDDRDRVFTPLQPSWELIRQAERERHGNDGLNDGLVSVRSMRWTDRLRGTREKEVVQRDFPVRGDHLNEVGWWDLHQLSDEFGRDALRDLGGLLGGVLGNRSEYENQIKGTYLSIAEDLERRFPV